MGSIAEVSKIPPDDIFLPLNLHVHLLFYPTIHLRSVGNLPTSTGFDTVKLDLSFWEIRDNFIHTPYSYIKYSSTQPRTYTYPSRPQLREMLPAQGFHISITTTQSTRVAFRHRYQNSFFDGTKHKYQNTPPSMSDHTGNHGVDRECIPYTNRPPSISSHQHSPINLSILTHLPQNSTYLPPTILSSNRIRS